MLGHFVSYLFGLSNAHTSMVAAFALQRFHVKQLQIEDGAKIYLL